uniref:Uncharacterized protein n=1 Tax=Rhizophora mucronata TaxID=61149 RepID=A0A2P2NY75_RHIMU
MIRPHLLKLTNATFSNVLEGG